MAYTITTHNGNSSKVRRDHNIRNPKYVEKEHHIDPNRPHEIWRDETAPHAYRRIFGPSVKEYNAKQKRPDRKIRNYHAEVKKSARKHDVYEMVIQIGSKRNAPDERLGHKILREFMDGWDERNPNLEAIGIYYHGDEEGGPHVHVDYVPVAHGYSRGPSVQPGLAKALGEQGFVVNKEWTAQTQFIRRENKTLEAICRHYGLDIDIRVSKRLSISRPPFKRNSRQPKKLDALQKEQKRSWLWRSKSSTRYRLLPWPRSRSVTILYVRSACSDSSATV